MTHSFLISIFLDFTDSLDYIEGYIGSSVHPKMKTDFIQTVNLLTTELQLRVKRSNNLLSLFLTTSLKKSYLFSLKSSSDGLY